MVATGTRLDLRPSVYVPARSSFGYLIPRATLHFTGYDFDEVAGDVPDSLSRTVPSFSVDGGLYFDHDVTVGERRFTQTLEPRLFYLRVPYRDQDRLPLFDAGSFSFGHDHMFRENRFSGTDRIGDADRLTLALDSRLLDGGREIFAGPARNDGALPGPPGAALHDRGPRPGPSDAMRERPQSGRTRSSTFRLDRRESRPPRRRVHGRGHGRVRRQRIAPPGRLARLPLPPVPRTNRQHRLSALPPGDGLHGRGAGVGPRRDGVRDPFRASRPRTERPGARERELRSRGGHDDGALHGIRIRHVLLERARGRATLPCPPAAPTTRARSCSSSSSRA